MQVTETSENKTTDKGILLYLVNEWLNGCVKSQGLDKGWEKWRKEL